MIQYTHNNNKCKKNTCKKNGINKCNNIKLAPPALQGRQRVTMLTRVRTHIENQKQQKKRMH